MICVYFINDDHQMFHADRNLKKDFVCVCVYWIWIYFPHSISLTHGQ